MGVNNGVVTRQDIRSLRSRVLAFRDALAEYRLHVPPDLVDEVMVMLDRLEERVPEGQEADNTHHGKGY